MSLRAEKLTAGYTGADVLSGVSLDFAPGQLTAVIGPNGSGKSTLLSLLAGLMRPRSGRALLGDRPIGLWPRHRLAQELAILPQMPSAPPEMKVRDLVAHGRFAHRPYLSPLRPEDRRIVSEALERTAMTDLSQRRFGELSGGERQRAWIALVLAQKPKWLLLDEPTSQLDLGNQYQLLDLIGQVTREDDMGTVIVLHDIQHAGRLADRIIAVSKGIVVADGPPDTVITSELVAKIYGIDVAVEWHGTGRHRHPSIVPLSGIDATSTRFSPTQPRNLSTASFQSKESKRNASNR